MSKRQLIDEIRSVNRTALPEFLARFDEVDLTDYLQHLIHSQAPRLRGTTARQGQYIATSTRTAAATLPRTVTAVAVLTDDIPEAEDVTAAVGASWRDAMVQAGAKDPDTDDAWIDDEAWIDDLTITSAGHDRKPLTLAAATPSTPATDKWLF